MAKNINTILLQNKEKHPVLSCLLALVSHGNLSNRVHCSKQIYTEPIPNHFLTHSFCDFTAVILLGQGIIIDTIRIGRTNLFFYLRLVLWCSGNNFHNFHLVAVLISLNIDAFVHPIKIWQNFVLKICKPYFNMAIFNDVRSVPMTFISIILKEI